MTRSCLFAAFGLSLLIAAAAERPAVASQKIPLKVLYLSRQDATARTTAFVDFLSQQFDGCVFEHRDDFRAELLRDVDVVVVDWSQDERHGNYLSSPVGPLEEWTTPTVLLGSAGLLMAEAWQVIGDAG